MTFHFPALRLRAVVARTALCAAALVLAGPALAAADEADVRAEYDFGVLAHWTEDEVLVSQIVTDSSETAQAAIARIAAGESFESVAAALSIDMASKHKGGDLGWAPPSQYFPEIESALKKMKPGEVSAAPVQSKLGWHVFKLRETRKFQGEPYAALHNRIAKAVGERITRIHTLGERVRADADQVKNQVIEYRVRRIRMPSEADALAVFWRLHDGADFNSLAYQLPLDQDEKASGGLQPWQAANMFEPVVGNVLPVMRVGETYPQALQTSEGWWLVKLEAERPFTHSQQGGDAVKELNAMFGTWPSGPEVVRELLKAGADPNALVEKQVPLARYCYFGEADTIRMLLAAGANPNPVPGAQSAPIDGCINGRDPQQFVPMLIQAGARLDALNGNGVSPLAAVVLKGDTELLRTMIRPGVPLDVHDNDSYTPLAIAALHNQTGILQLLLQSGANPMEPLHSLRAGDPTLYTALSAAAKKREQDKVAPDTLPILRKLGNNLVRANSKRAIEAFIVQDGKRHPIDGRPVTIKRAPFDLEIVEHGGNDVLVGLSNDSESIAAIRRNVDESRFGDDYYVVKENDEEGSLGVAGTSNFRFYHWSSFSRTGHLDVQTGPKGEVHARRQVQVLHYLTTDPDAGSATDHSVNVANVNDPLSLLVGVGEPIGWPFTTVTKMVSAPIQWR